MARPSTRVLKNRINHDLFYSDAAVQISSLRRTPSWYRVVYEIPGDQFDELSKEELRTVERIVKKHCRKVATK